MACIEISTRFALALKSIQGSIHTCSFLEHIFKTVIINAKFHHQRKGKSTKSYLTLSFFTTFLDNASKFTFSSHIVYYAHCPNVSLEKSSIEFWASYDNSTVWCKDLEHSGCDVGCMLSVFQISEPTCVFHSLAKCVQILEKVSG